MPDIGETTTVGAWTWVVTAWDATVNKIYIRATDGRLYVDQVVSTEDYAEFVDMAR